MYTTNKGERERERKKFHGLSGPQPSNKQQATSRMQARSNDNAS